VPLPHYGVAIGVLESFTRDPQHHYGSWYHGHIALGTSDGTWQSALDVDAPQAVGVSYRVVENLGVADLGPVGALSDGFHELAHTSSSGALDYLRAPTLRDGLLVSRLRRAILSRRVPAGWQAPPPDVGLPGGADPGDYGPPPFGPDPLDSLLELWLGVQERIPTDAIDRVRWRSLPWISSNGDNALDGLEPHVRNASRIYIFGERYQHDAKGVHDIHMNQGDPAGSQWYFTSGTWQDGAVACQGQDGRVAIWQLRFNTQSLHTDDQGHPVQP